MKNLAFVFFLAAIAMSCNSSAQVAPKLDASPMDMAMFRPDGRGSAPVARVIYSRPSKNDRDIFGSLVPYGEIWRLGANESTEITLYKELTMGEKKVPAGTYTMYAIPGEEEWTIILNSKLNTWGAYQYDESQDVARFKAQVKEGKSVQEAFGIGFEGSGGSGKLLMAWDKTIVEGNFSY